MLPFHDWLLLASICALGAMAPGISLAVVTRHTLHGGHRAGAIAGVTHALGIGIWAAATVTGMAILFHRYPVLEQLFSMAGALFLLWMAWKSWQAGRAAAPRRFRRAQQRASRRRLGRIHGGFPQPQGGPVFPRRVQPVS